MMMIKSSGAVGLAVMDGAASKIFAKEANATLAKNKEIDQIETAKINPVAYIQKQVLAKKAINAAVEKAISDAYDNLDGDKEFITEQERRELAIEFGKQKEKEMRMLFERKFPLQAFEAARTNLDHAYSATTKADKLAPLWY